MESPGKYKFKLPHETLLPTSFKLNKLNSTGFSSSSTRVPRATLELKSSSSIHNDGRPFPPTTTTFPFKFVSGESVGEVEKRKREGRRVVIKRLSPPPLGIPFD